MADEPPRPDLDRRELLASAGAAVAGRMLLAEAVGRADNPAAHVEDRGAGVRITALKTHLVGPKVYVRLDTNRQVSGWGEISALEPRTAATLAESLFELLDGENPTRIEYLWQKLYRAHRDIRGGPFMVHTIAAIDMALWDVTGKLWGVPVYRLLGGPCRDRIRVYPTAKAHKAPPGGVYPFSCDPPDIQNMVRMVKEARKQVGPDGAVMFDAHCAIPPPALIQFAAAIEPYDVLWIEEPAVPGNIEVFKKLRQAIRVPLATGERDRTIWEMLPYLQHQAVDILQPDVAHTGGITQMKKIATLAEAYYTPLAPHCTTSPLGATASLHVTASVPLFLIHETAPQNLAWGEQFLQALGHRPRRLRLPAGGPGARRRSGREENGPGGRRPEAEVRLAPGPAARRLGRGLLTALLDLARPDGVWSHRRRAATARSWKGFPC
jgi:galactonate dehydratase